MTTPEMGNRPAHGGQVRAVPGGQTAAAPTVRGTTDTDRAPRRRVSKVVHEREIACICDTCGATFDNTGAAASHAGARGHRVLVDYWVRFDFLPRGAA